MLPNFSYHPPFVQYGGSAWNCLMRTSPLLCKRSNNIQLCKNRMLDNIHINSLQIRLCNSFVPFHTTVVSPINATSSDVKWQNNFSGDYVSVRMCSATAAWCCRTEPRNSWKCPWERGVMFEGTVDVSYPMSFLGWQYVKSCAKQQLDWFRRTCVNASVLVQGLITHGITSNYSYRVFGFWEGERETLCRLRDKVKWGGGGEE